MSLRLAPLGNGPKKWCVGGVVDGRYFGWLLNRNFGDEELRRSLHYVYEGPAPEDAAQPVEHAQPTNARDLLLDLTIRLREASKQQEHVTRLLALLVLAVGVARLDTVEAYTFQDPALPLAVEQADAVPGAVLDLAEMLRWVTVEELPAAMQLVRQVEVKRAMSDPASELDAGAGGAASGDVLPQLVRATAMILASQLAAELLLTWLTPERDIMPAKLQKNKVAKSLLRWVQVYPSGLDVDQVLSLHTSAVDELEKADVARTPVNPTFLHCAVQQREQAVSSLHVATPFLLANNRLKCDMLLRCGWRGAVKRLLDEELDTTLGGFLVSSRVWCAVVDAGGPSRSELIVAWHDLGWWKRVSAYLCASYKNGQALALEQVAELDAAFEGEELTDEKMAGVLAILSDADGVPAGMKKGEGPLDFSLVPPAVVWKVYEYFVFGQLPPLPAGSTVWEHLCPRMEYVYKAAFWWDDDDLTAPVATGVAEAAVVVLHEVAEALCICPDPCPCLPQLGEFLSLLEEPMGSEFFRQLIRKVESQRGGALPHRLLLALRRAMVDTQPANLSAAAGARRMIWSLATLAVQAAKALDRASLLCEMQQVADWQSEALLARQKARLNARAAWHYLDAAIQLMKQEMTFSRPFDGSNGAPPPTSHEAALGMLRIAVRHMPDSLQKVASALQSFAGSPDRDGALAEEVSLAASEGMPELLLPLEWAGWALSRQTPPAHEVAAQELEQLPGPGLAALQAVLAATAAGGFRTAHGPVLQRTLDAIAFLLKQLLLHLHLRQPDDWLVDCCTCARQLTIEPDINRLPQASVKMLHYLHSCTQLPLTLSAAVNSNLNERAASAVDVDSLGRLLDVFSSNEPSLFQPASELEESGEFTAEQQDLAAQQHAAAVADQSRPTTRREQLQQRLRARRAQREKQLTGQADPEEEVRRRLRLQDGMDRSNETQVADHLAQELLEEEEAAAAAAAARAAKKAAKRQRQKQRKKQGGAAAQRGSTQEEPPQQQQQQQPQPEQQGQQAQAGPATPVLLQPSLSAAPVADASPPAAGTAGPGDEEPEDEAPWQTMVAGRTSAEARTLQPAGLERRPQQQQPPRVQQQQAARQQQQQQQVRPGAEQDEVELWSLLAQLGLEGDSQAGRSAAAAAGGPSSSRPATGGAWPAPAAVPLAAPTTPVLVPPVPLPAAPAAAGAAPERQQQPEMPPAIHKALQELVRLLECPLGLETLTDPVLAADGHVYDRPHIEASLRRHAATSPLTGAAMPDASLREVRLVREIIELFRSAAPDYFFDD